MLLAGAGGGLLTGFGSIDAGGSPIGGGGGEGAAKS